MKSLLWLVRALVLPILAVALLAWWSAAAIDRTGGEGMPWWAAVFLFAGLGVSALVPRVAIVSLYGAFVLQLVRPECRFDQAGWLPYAAVMFVAIVLAARTAEAGRRRVLTAMLPLGFVIGLFTNLPSLGPAIPTSSGTDTAGTYGLVNGTTWAPLTTFGGWELLVGLLVWSAAAVLLIVAAWMIGSTYRARAMQWRAEAEAATARVALSDSRSRLVVAEERDRIAQDVHDITAHSLSVIAAQADGAAAHADGSTTRTALETIAGSARQALTELRGLLERLEQHSDGDTSHSAAEIGDLVETVRAAGARVVLLQQGSAAALSQAADLAVYRIVQEALTNALRHGTGSEAIRVVLDWQKSGLALTISSPVAPNGSTETGGPGRGVVGMQQRARLAGGWLTTGTDVETANYLVTAYIPRLRAVHA